MTDTSHYLFKLAALGGTFDILHKGHRRLLKEAFLAAEKVIIGVTSDLLVARLKKPHPVRPYSERVLALKALLRDMGVADRAQIIPLEDPYGPTIVDPSIQAIIVSEETMDRAFEINEIRERQGLPPLAIVVIRMVLAENGRPISCTRIRRGEIDPEGRVLYSKASR